MNNKLYFILLIVILASCKTPLVNQQVHHSATAIPELLSIGKQPPALLERPFQIIGVPNLPRQIRLDIKQLPYNQTSYKAYTYHQKQMNKEVGFTLKDSINPAPNFFQLSVLDRITLAETFNADPNKVLQDYIMEDSEILMVSSILFNVSNQIRDQLLEAEEAYAIQNGVSNVEIQLVKEGHVFATLNLSELQPFSYGVSNFCWGLDKRNRPEIKAIINNKDCPQNTKTKAYKLESPYNYKF